ncbi:MAG: ROK family protein [Candidatus Dormibacteria bacterium]
MTLAAGVDLGGTKIQVVVLRRGTVVGEARVLTPRGTGADVVAAIKGALADAMGAAKAAPGELTAIGVGSPGLIDSAAGVVRGAANVPGLEVEFDLGPKLAKAMNVSRVVLENDVRAAMLGEHRSGAGRPFKNLLGVFLGTGVGGGLVLDGKLRRGLGAAGEIGHTVVMDRGRQCSCGREGCLEAYAGRGRMERTAREWVAQGEKTVLFEVMKERGRDRLSSGVIVDAMARKDFLARAMVTEAAWALSIALSNAQNLLDLEAIIIGGGLGDRLGASFVASVETQMRPHLFARDRAPKMLAAGLGDLSGAVGAALMVSS